MIKFYEFWRYTLRVMNSKCVFSDLWILTRMLCLTKCDYMSSSRYAFGKRAHVLTEAITKYSRAMIIVVTVVMCFIVIT